ncbi:hypothetical protein [Microbulbifer sp. YPW1]|uniref:hypothetical protein n=1 Tax=Microbulbifer sp. YPW1 TaxID=2745199 RepID=UPI00159A1485|nr:hypothetical protein [Microbulbifer sp. YPW1]QKX17176.1 hypothetical protein HUW35_09295 [Microbulbifer sp. YPW1]
MKKTVVALHDYQHGGAAMLVRCDNVEELKSSLGKSWKVISENVESHPYYKYAIKKSDPIYEFAKPAGLLEVILFISKRQQEGKTGYPIKIESQMGYIYREVWARSEADVVSVFPGCKFVYGEILNEPLERSDIDIEDDFIRKYRA